MQFELQYTFGISTLLLLIFSLHQVRENVKYRKLAAVRYRGLQGQMFVILFFSLMIFAVGIAGTFNLSCWYLPIYQLFVNCAGSFILERVFMLYTNHILEQKKIQFARNRKQVSKIFTSKAEFISSPLTGHQDNPTVHHNSKFTDWLDHNRNKFKRNGRFMSVAKLLTLNTGISQGIVFGVVFFLLTPEVTNPSITFYDPVCIMATQRMYRVITAVVMLAIVGVLWVSKNLRGIQENLFLKKEFGFLGYSGMLDAIWNLTYIFLPPQMAGNFTPFFLLGNQVVSVLAIYFASHFVINHARKEEEKKNHTLSHSTDHAATSAHHELDSPSSPSARNTKKTRDGREHLIQILLDDHQFAPFEMFLSKEFSVENGYFCRNVQRYSHMCEQHAEEIKNPAHPTDDSVHTKRKDWFEEIFHYAEMIYEDYCTPNARMCINISHEHRIQLQKLFERKKNGDSLSHGGFITESCNVFAVASTEIFDLMLHDTFRRYLRSDEYLNHAKANQITSEV